MDYKQMIGQTLDFNRTIFDNGFNAVVIWQDQVERSLRALREQAAWLPSEGQAVVDEWVGALKKGRDDFRKAVDGSFDKAAELLGR
jgi:hypothetical protein